MLFAMNRIVIHDDIALEPGILKVKWGGSTGGHNGLNHISTQIGTKEYSRLRIGIGKPLEGNQVLADYVLSRIPKQEFSMINDSIPKALDCLDSWVASGFDEARKVSNQKPKPE